MAKSFAMRYVGPEKVDVIEVDVGDPGPGEIQVLNRACGICAWDLATFQSGPESDYPAPAGHEGVGEVTSIGPGVSGWEVGDWIAGGGFTGLRNIAAAKGIRLPRAISADDLPYWIVEPVTCAVSGVDNAEIRPGDRVVLSGCGYMGLLLAQLLVKYPISELTAIDLDPTRLEVARRLGATRAVNSNDPDAAAKATAGGVDIVIEASGSVAACQLAVELTPRGGRIIFFGWTRGPLTLDGSHLHTKGVRIVNASPSANRLTDLDRRAVSLMEKGAVTNRPLVTHVRTLPELAELLAIGLKKDDGYIKGVVTIPDIR